jgi:hypothetical protein
MNFSVRARLRAFVIGCLLFQTLSLINSAWADPPSPCQGRTVVVRRARPRIVSSASTTLGTFTPTPYIWVAGSHPTGTGYSPLGIYGDQTLPLYGPMSALRTTTAPVLVYTRGYDGQIHVAETNSFSYPNLPGVSQVVYPTESNYYYGPRVNRTPPWGSSAINWIDQN